MILSLPRALKDSLTNLSGEGIKKLVFNLALFVDTYYGQMVKKSILGLSFSLAIAVIQNFSKILVAE